MLNFREISSYTVIGLLPVLALCLSIQFGIHWALASLALMTVITSYFDLRIHHYSNQPAINKTVKILPYILFLSHMVILPFSVWILCQPNSPLEKVMLFLSFGLFLGMISMANGHELIHRTGRLPNTMGRLIFITLSFGHHVSSHLLIHHRFAASPKDPCSARLGQSFYEFLAIAWIRSFTKGFAAENTRRRMKSGKSGPHPYLFYVVGSLLSVLAFYLWLGLEGAISYLTISIFAASQLLLTDYIQHYGLSRSIIKTGKLEPMGPNHSWDAPFLFSSRLTLNAPLHSEHHTHPSKPYYELVTSNDQPTLPYPIPVMAMIALVPTIWFKTMDQRAQEFR
jgi:alkane 1-monooxygenase